MWTDLSKNAKESYKQLILAFASLTETFTQKAEDNIIPAPIINSKFQETAFQKAFQASAEDIGNTSYDVALKTKDFKGNDIKYLVGIKTFGINSGDQKIAQFKSNHNDWAELIDKIQQNSRDENGELRSKEEINQLNYEYYLDLATKISIIRNERIQSSIENLRGFKVEENDNVESIYHVLMPSSKGSEPVIYVGETSYNKINIDSISIIGCTSNKTPTNFSFTDGIHTYKFTSADSQLSMKFNNKDITVDNWNVKYAEDAYSIFSNIASEVYGSENSESTTPKITESYSWLITNKEDEVELFSGFNTFYGIGSKLGKEKRIERIIKLKDDYAKQIEKRILTEITTLLQTYLIDPASTKEEKLQKIKIREQIIKLTKQTENQNLLSEITKLLFRPMNEIYIPIPNARKFHTNHPNFFGPGIGAFKGEKDSRLLHPKEFRVFNLVFEPSGNTIESYITQDNGKAIESFHKQSILGEWILRKVFQLSEYEPLTTQKLYDLEINGIRLYKTTNSGDIHLKFIWIDKDNLPEDFIS